MKRTIVSFILSLSVSFILAQVKKDTTYTFVSDAMPVAENVLGYDADAGWPFSLNYYGIGARIIEIGEDIANKVHTDKVAEEIHKAMDTLASIKIKHQSYSQYPSTIIDGWHLAVVTDNANFCSKMKILVHNNTDKRIIVNDYFPVNFDAPRQIRNAKNTLTLKKFCRQQLTTVDVYFMNDIEQQTIVKAPQKCGYVCFWSDLKNAEDIVVKIQDKKIGKVPSQIISEPECFNNGMLCKILRPGQYSLIALGRGAIVWRGEFLVKENACLKYYLGKSNKAWE